MKKAKLSDIADRAGVSIATVSRVIHQNGYVAAEKKAAIEEAIRQLEYQLPEKKSVPQKKPLIGSIISYEKTNYFHSQMMFSLASAAQQKEMGLLPLVLEQKDKKHFLKDLNWLVEEGVSGIVIVSVENITNDEESRTALRECGVPIVIVERGSCYGFNRVLVDTSAGIYLATSHLLELGHKKLLYLGNELTNDVAYDRILGFQRAIQDHHLDPREQTTVILSGDSEQVGYEGIQKGLKLNPDITGIVTWSDAYAAGAFQYFREIGKSVPKDFSVIGYDDIFASLLSPPLTSVNNPIEEMAAAAIDMITQSAGPGADSSAKTVMFNPRLVLRSSTAPPSR